MKVLPSLLVLLCGFWATALGSILSVDDGGVYSGITVRIGDDVPRQYCRRVIDGVQVGDIVQWASVIYRVSILVSPSSVKISGYLRTHYDSLSP